MVYLFSGLGADERVFQFLDLKTPTQIIYWIAPKPSENLESYARRIVAEQITEPLGAILIGVSFGGIIAQEVARQIHPRKVILISSIKTHDELPSYYRQIGWLHRWLPSRLLRFPGWLGYYFFGVSQPSHRALLKAILRDTDPKFLRWAIAQVLAWQNNQMIDNVVHIHGDKDKILPFFCVKEVICVTNGGHLMVVTHNHEVSTVIKKVLET